MDILGEIQSVIDDALAGVCTVMHGVVQGVKNGRADVLPKMARKMPDGESLALPMVHSVPVMMPSSASGSAGVTWQIKPGDTVLLLAFQHGDDGEYPFTLAHCCCIPFSFGRSTSNNSVKVFSGGSEVSISDSGAITINSSSSISIQSSGTMSIKGSSIQMAGNVTVSGSLSVAGSMTNGGINIGASHTHGGVENGRGRTSPPS